jgi:hypothetical protein
LNTLTSRPVFRVVPIVRAESPGWWTRESGIA